MKSNAPIVIAISKLISVSAHQNQINLRHAIGSLYTAPIAEKRQGTSGKVPPRT